MFFSSDLTIFQSPFTSLLPLYCYHFIAFYSLVALISFLEQFKTPSPLTYTNIFPFRPLSHLLYFFYLSFRFKTINHHYHHRHQEEKLLLLLLLLSLSLLLLLLFVPSLLSTPVKGKCALLFRCCSCLELSALPLQKGGKYFEDGNN
uniref:Uncharacterized protein n=1 Tax=Trypanosoma vivax (strain Y486) TaxID=1055687 RepID=G0U035_TRYVY|nr:hypothetical protein, unlikely [Trypanosoma vivax Y486]